MFSTVSNYSMTSRPAILCPRVSKAERTLSAEIEDIALGKDLYPPRRKRRSPRGNRSPGTDEFDLLHWQAN